MDSNSVALKYYKNSTRMIELFGLLSAIINGIFFVLVLMTDPLSIINAAIFLVSLIIGIVLVVLGGKSRKEISVKSKPRLIVILVIGLLVLITNIFTGGSSLSLGVPTIISASAFIALYYLSKLNTVSAA